MSTQARRLTLLGGLAAVAFLIAWLISGGVEESGDGASQRLAPAASPAAELPRFDTDAGKASAPAALVEGEARTTPPAATQTGATRLIVRVTWASDGSPAADIGLRVLPNAREEALRDTAIRGRTDASGAFILDPAPPGKIGVLTDRDGHVFGEIVAGHSTELGIAMPEGTSVRGRVLDADGQIAPEAEIWLSNEGNTRLGTVVARSGPDGRFTLRGVSGQRWIGARRSGVVPSPLDEIKQDGPPLVELTFELGKPAGVLQGLVVDRESRPVPGAFVRVGPDGGWRSSDPRHSEQSRPPLDLETDEAGRFVAADLPPGVVWVAVKHAGFSPWNQPVDTLEGGTAETRIVLVPGAALEGTARDSSGAPLEGVRVTVGQSPAQMTWVSVMTDAAGHYVLRDPPLRLQEVVASKKDAGEDKHSVEFVAGETLDWDPVISTGRVIVGRVVDESSAAVEGLHVRAVHAAGFDGWLKTVNVAADGRFTIPNCEDKPHSLEVMDRDYRLSLATQADAWPGPDEIVVRIAASARQTAGVFGRVADGQGALRPDVEVMLAAVGASFAVTGKFDGTSGEFSFDKARAGDYELHVIVRHQSLLKIPVPALLPGEHRDLGTIMLAEPGRIVVHATLPAGVDPANVLCAVKNGAGGGHFKLDSSLASTWSSDPIAAGDYTVALASGSGDEHSVFFMPLQAAVRVEAGRDARVDLVAERGVAQMIWVATQRDPPPQAFLVVIDAGGAELRRVESSWGEPLHGPGSQAGLSFIGRPGPYKLRVEAEGQLVAELDFNVPAGMNIGPDVRLSLP
jgi:hypothetical protein